MYNPEFSYAGVLKEGQSSKASKPDPSPTEVCPTHDRAESKADNDSTDSQANGSGESSTPRATNSKLNARASSFRSDSSRNKSIGSRPGSRTCSQPGKPCEDDNGEESGFTAAAYAQQGAKEDLSAQKTTIFDPALMVAQVAQANVLRRQEENQATGQTGVHEIGHSREAAWVAVWRGDCVVYLPPANASSSPSRPEQ